MSILHRYSPINVPARFQVKLLLFGVLFLMIFSAKGQPLQYPPPDPLWTADSLGNRRAVVQVREDGEAILAHIEWRRSDTLFLHNAIYIVDSNTDQQIQSTGLRRNLR